MKSVSRWLRWTFRCRRGRDCADNIFGDRIELMHGPVPVGAVVVLDWDCDGCGTHYRNEAFIGDLGELIQTGRTRRDDMS